MRAAAPRLVLAGLLFVPAASLSQPGPVTRPAPPLKPQPVGPAHEIVIYRDRNFSGPAVSIPQNESNLRLAWTVSSAKVRSGTWELCERPNYQGSCLTISNSSSNLGHRRVQSARVRSGWRRLGDTEINRVGFDHRTINVRGNPRISALRFCAERTGIRIQGARARFTNNRTQTLRVPSTINNGRCSDPLAVSGGPRNISFVDVTASTTGLVTSARGLIRLEGR